MNLLGALKENVFANLTKEERPPGTDLDYLTLFGLLLYEVAAVSQGISEDEQLVIKEIMVRELDLKENEWGYTYEVIKATAGQEINLRRITSEFNKVADYETRKAMLINLLKVASADGIIEKVEFIKIKWLANYLWITPKDFNELKQDYHSIIEF